MKRFLITLFLISVQISFSQDYKRVDSIVKNYPKEFESIKNFADKIDSDFTTDLDKTRATYFWISNNIFYDFETASSNRIKDVFYTGNEDLEQMQNAYAENALKKRKAICEGYSQLLKYTLKTLGIKCEVIEGYAKTNINDIGKINHDQNHAWNAVFIDKKWHLIDATWSTGNELGKPNYVSFRDSYFLIKPEHLIWSHYPNNKKWQLLEKPVSKLAFFYAPIIHVGYYDSSLKLNKMKGIIKPKKMIQISFEDISEENQYYYQYSEYSLNLEPLEFLKKGNSYIAYIPYNYKKGKELLIFNGFEPCLSFKVN